MKFLPRQEEPSICAAILFSPALRRVSRYQVELEDNVKGLLSLLFLLYSLRRLLPSMSDAEGNIEALCDDLEDQYLSVGPEPLSRRDSDNSDTSQVSSLAGTRRRSRGGQMSQVEGGERRGKKKKVYPKVRSGCDTVRMENRPSLFLKLTFLVQTAENQVR